MKKFLSLGIAAVLAATMFAGCSGKDENTVVMYTNAEFPPFEYRSDNEIVGVDVDIAKEVAKDLGKELKIVDTKFDSIIPAITSGKGDFGAAGMTITDERKESVDFSIEYIKSTQYIIVTESSDVKSLEDLKGKKIGVQLGTTGDLISTKEVNGVKADPENDVEEYTGVLQDTGAEVKTYANALEASIDLKSGKIDAVVIDKLPAENIVANSGGALKTFEMTDTDEMYAFCVNKGNTELLDSINKTMQRLLDEGKIDEYVLNHTTK